MRRVALPLLILIVAALACGSPPAPEPPAPSPPPLSPDRLPSPTHPPLPAGTSSPVPAPAEADRAAALMEAVSAGRLMEHVRALASIPTRHVNSATINDAAQYIHGAFTAAGGRISVAYDPFPLSYNGVASTQYNVVATLPGSDPAAGVILLGAHYDSRTVDLRDALGAAPGADDNATGVAVLLELARVLADEPLGATLVFVAFSAEEVNLGGSRHYLEQARTRGEDIRAVIVLDIVGNAGGAAGESAIRVFSAPPEDSPSRQLAYFVAEQGARYLPGFEVRVQPTIDRPGRYSDHVPFSEAGIPAVRLIETIEDTARQHSADDRPESLSPAYLQKAARLALVSTLALAGEGR